MSTAYLTLMDGTKKMFSPFNFLITGKNYQISRKYFKYSMIVQKIHLCYFLNNYSDHHSTCMEKMISMISDFQNRVGNF